MYLSRSRSRVRHPGFGRRWLRRRRGGSEIAREMRMVEEYIEGMPEGIDKQIFEMVYLDGMTQTEAGESVGYTQGRVSQIIKCWIKD
ncbi:MAG: sigma factor-like helix-turn-helix DNA-binding protein [[Clostridium] scindens]